MSEIFQQSKYEILTPDGFVDFYGSRKVDHSGIIYTITTESGNTITCSAEHEIDTFNGYVEAKDLTTNELIHEIRNNISSFSQIKSISTSEKNISLYDLVHVQSKNHKFIYNNCVVSNCAFIPPTTWDEFYKSTYPTISSGTETKIVLVSTPNGMNHFHKLWTDAEAGRNKFKPHRVMWDQVPGRDEKWKEETIANTSEMEFAQEHGLSFLGSANTLIATWKLKQMGYREPIYQKDELKVYHKPRPDGIYVGVCDIAEGVGGDYSTMAIIDISGDSGYKIVAIYRNNKISTLLFPDVIYKIGKEYNDAYLLIETNSIGKQVADVLHGEFEYENILMTTSGGRNGQTISSGFGRAGGKLGVKTTNPVRRIGCSTLKTLVEENKLLIESYDIISELASFVFYKGKYQAEVGHHDDLTMTLVLFGWLTQQPYFRDLLDINIRAELYEDKIKQIEEDLVPFGFIDDGTGDIDDDLPGGWQKAAEFLPF